LWTWMDVGNFDIRVTLTLDGLSFTILSVVTGVGFYIHLFATWYNPGEEAYYRNIDNTNLNIARMVIQELADNILMMY
ncbi:NADH-quinone oxidoreductase subunit L, partial [Pectobacterium brasiliense]|nr:NADH-quinone oxidoreductase subunit L [Pectobacterium brasiliense]